MDTIIENKKIIKLVAMYARVSTGRQEDEETIKNQIMVIEDLATKNGYTIVKRYVDDGWSGDMLARPNLDQLREDAKNKIWEAVIIYDPDRLARRYSYQELVMDELREAGIEVIFVTMPAPKNPEEKVMYGMRGLFAEWERVKITERFRLGKLRKAREGHIVGHEAPYGYTYIKKKEKELGYYVINEKEARVVRMIFNWVANEGLTIRGVAKRLHELGIKPRESKKEMWNISTLGTLLNRKTYIGESYYLRTCAIVPQNPIKKEVYKKIKKTSRRIRPEEEWIKIPTPVIISKELFEKAGQAMKKNYSLCVRNKKNEYLLAGRVFCTCGRRRTGEGPQHGKHLYYRCSDRVYSFPSPRKCFEHGINARWLDNLVWRKVAEFMSSPELITREAEKWLTKRNSATQVVDFSEEQINKEIEKLKKEEDRYVMAFGSEAITLDQLKEHTAGIKDKMSSLRGQLLYLDQQKMQSANLSLPSLEELTELCQEVKNMLNYVNPQPDQELGFELKRKMVLELVDRVVGDQKEVLVEGYLPLNQNYYVELKTNNRNCGLAKCGKVYII